MGKTDGPIMLGGKIRFESWDPPISATFSKIGTSRRAISDYQNLRNTSRNDIPFQVVATRISQELSERFPDRELNQLRLRLPSLAAHTVHQRGPNSVDAPCSSDPSVFLQNVTIIPQKSCRQVRICPSLQKPRLEKSIFRSHRIRKQ
jgi:hypothetical protein